MLVGCFAFPANPLCERVIELDGAWFWAIRNAAALIPAFLRIKDNRRFAFIRIGNEKICDTYMDAHIATIAGRRINYYRIGRRIAVWKCIGFCFSQVLSPDNLF